jgi:hypothetical protein
VRRRKEGNKKGIVLLVEGDTEKAFYTSLIQFLQNKNQTKQRVEKVHIVNLKGVGNYGAKGPNKFKNEICRDNPDVDYNVFCAYDMDVFQYAMKPPVDWKVVEKTLKKYGALQVFHIRAYDKIEDWFLFDLEGLCTYLEIDALQPKGKDGLEKIKVLFKKKNKIYQKGSTDQFIPYLNMEKIYMEFSEYLNPLEKYLFVES